MSCFVKFNIPEDKNFNDLKTVFDLIKDAKEFGRPKPDRFWVEKFPDYALKNFSFLDNDEKPEIHNNDENPFTWHFYSLISLLQIDYELTYDDCFKTSKTTGQLNYSTYSYPYGGITDLIIFISSFSCTPTIIDDGTSVYEINFLNNGDFSITDLEDPNRQNSSKKLFDSSLLLQKFAQRFKFRK